MTDAHFYRPPMRALHYEFDDPSLFGIDEQFMVGSSLLVTPVLRKGKESVKGIFPNTDGVTWTNWFTHEVRLCLDIAGQIDTD